MLPATELFPVYEKAQALIAEGDLRQAADLCKKMLDTNPNFPYGYHLMSSLFRATGTFSRALTFADMAIRLAPDIADFHIQQGHVFFALEEWEAAVSAFQKAHILEPNNPMPLLWWADTYVRQGLLEEAFGLFKQARKVADICEVDEHEGLCLLSKGDILAAETLFDRMIDKQPNYCHGYIYKGKALFAQNRFGQAEAYFAKAVSLDPKAPEALHYMALVNERQGLQDIAISYAMQAVQADPCQWKSHHFLGNLLLDQHYYEAAEQVLRQAHAFKPNDAYILQLFMTSLLRQRKSVEALQFIETSLQADPNHKMMQYVRAMVKGGHCEAVPQEYIASFFDGYSDQYERRTQLLTYRAPALMSDMVRTMPMVTNEASLNLLDLGCGTGLMAKALQDITQFRVGVDLSEQMIAKARSTQIYHELYSVDILEFMLGSSRTFDVVAAADVLIHAGHLSAFFQAARNVMTNKSLLLVSIELEAGKQPFRLNSTGHYSHSAPYIQALAAEEGYSICAQKDIALRTEHYTQVQGVIYLFKKVQAH